MKFRVPNKENHYALWDWLSRNPVMPDGSLSEKTDWPGYETIMDNENLHVRYPEHLAEYACFACQEVGFDSNGRRLCRTCPCCWKPGETCTSIGSPYFEWDFCPAQLQKSRSRLARKIRDCWK
jgi:hypothetical protein